LTQPKAGTLSNDTRSSLYETNTDSTNDVRMGGGICTFPRIHYRSAAGLHFRRYARLARALDTIPLQVYIGRENRYLDSRLCDILKWAAQAGSNSCIKRISLHLYIDSATKVIRDPMLRFKADILIFIRSYRPTFMIGLLRGAMWTEQNR
jgi:hypothetical protein